MKEKRIVTEGIDSLPDFADARLGLITNPTGMDKRFCSTVDILHGKGVLHCLFSPEHGVRGEMQAGEHVKTYTDKKTGLPVHSVYGGDVHISRDVLQNLDAVAFDIRDIGARYYTYLSTLSYAMEDCAAAGKKLYVFDRVNPVGGAGAEGTVLGRDFSSFVGRYPVAARHNLTVGEFARYINATERIGCDLTVVPLSGWTRDCYFDETDLPWVAPSPNIPTPDSALAYLCTCPFEGTNLSEGRGTTRPFEIIGAPWLDADRIADELNGMGLPGVRLRVCWFTPTFSKHAQQACRGLQIHVTDRRAFLPFETGMYLLDRIRRTHAEFAFLPPYREGGHAFIDLLMGTDELRGEAFDVSRFLSEQRVHAKAYEERAKAFYLYE